MAYNDYKKRIVQSRWHLVLFFLLEIISLILVVSSNNNQKLIFNNSIGIFKNKIDQRFSNLSNYINLENVVDSLVEENAMLIQEMNNRKFNTRRIDSTGISNLYEVIPAKVISRTIGKRKNYVVIDKGRSSRISEGSGVISNRSIIGIVTESTEHFSRVMTLDHAEAQVSIRIGAKHQFGIMKWKPWSEDVFSIEDFPKYWEVELGDTVYTSGFSTLFPADIALGRITEMELSKSSNKRIIEMRLFQDIHQEKNVYVLKNNYRDQLDSLLSKDEE